MQMALVLDDLETSYNRGSLTEIPLTHAARISAKVSQYAGDIFLGVGGYNGTYYNGFNFLGDEWKTFRYFFPQIYEYMSPYTQTEDGGPSHVAPTSHVAQTPDISLPLSHGTPTSHVAQAPGASSPLSHVAPAHTAHIVQPQQVHESTDIDDDVLIIDDEVPPFNVVKGGTTDLHLQTIEKGDSTHVVVIPSAGPSNSECYSEQLQRAPKKPLLKRQYSRLSKSCPPKKLFKD